MVHCLPILKAWESQVPSFFERNKRIPKLAEISKPDSQSLPIELTNPKGLGISGSVFSL